MGIKRESRRTWETMTTKRIKQQRGRTEKEKDNISKTCTWGKMLSSGNSLTHEGKNAILREISRGVYTKRKATAHKNVLAGVRRMTQDLKTQVKPATHEKRDLKATPRQHSGQLR